MYYFGDRYHLPIQSRPIHNPIHARQALYDRVHLKQQPNSASPDAEDIAKDANLNFVELPTLAIDQNQRESRLRAGHLGPLKVRLEAVQLPLETGFICSSFTHRFRACQGTFIPQDFLSTRSRVLDPSNHRQIGADLPSFSRKSKWTRRKTGEESDSII